MKRFYFLHWLVLGLTFIVSVCFIIFIMHKIVQVRIVIKDDIEVTEQQLKTHLTQEETLKFKTGPVKIQIRYVKPDGEADASNIIETRASEILKDGVITYGV